MINIQSCDCCVHRNVCGKKDGYRMFAEEISKVAIIPTDMTLWYAKDCRDIILDLRCKFYVAEETIHTKEVK